MATPAERAQLMSVSCPWCGAGPEQECYVGSKSKRRPITSLDGGSHDARWQKALGRPATVIEAVVAEAHPTRDDREPVSVGQAVADRPW